MKALDLRGGRRLTLGAAFAGFLLAAASPALPPPALHLTLHPVSQGGGVARVEVRMVLEDPHLAANEALLRMPTRIVGIPTSAYEPGEIDARDRQGRLALTAQDEPQRPEGIYRRYLVGRATDGDVVIRYAAKPREVGPTTNNGPLFDMRREGAGFEGAGISFLAVPPGETPYRVTLDWDFSGMPTGSRGAWSLGEGRVERVATAQQLAFSYYSGGPFHRFPGSGKFGIFWLTEPPFAIATLADRISRLYATMSGFFDDRDSTYRVFLRQDPYRGVGGTALPGSFMVGYYAPAHPTVDEIQQLLAHEMVHNWPALQGEHGDTAWYSEGTAEYYSLIFAYRAGLLDRAGLLREVNERANSYYTHSFRSLTNKEAAQRFWSDPFVQQVPYGRGFLYLARTDAAIRAASDGRRSLDDVVRELRRRQLAGQPYGIPQWLELVAAEIGRERTDRDYQDMIAGKAVEPDTAFAPCFRGVKEQRPVFDLGFARRSLADDATVRELRPESNAAHAGLREGDVILSYSELKPLIANAAAQMVLKVRRDGAERTIAYLPRGAPVEVYVFADDPSVPSDRCRF